jgi:serine protease Do
LSIQEDFEKVADVLRPSVVSIKSRETFGGGGMLRQGRAQGDNPFDFQAPGFPGFPGGQQRFQMIPQEPQTRVASGSGVIVRSDGYILTNDHVVAGADKVTVTLLDGREFVGQVRRDPKSDLALIKINADHLPAAQLADSDKVHIGQWAIAFGSPFALNDTMTVGVISSLHRQQTISDSGEVRYYPSLLQTDASINPGNSGGPLVDVFGRVVGVNVAIESPTGGNVGIGFAIPANTARFIMDQLISKGTVTRGYLGLVPAALSYEDQQRYGVKEGALVTLVVEGKPAAQGGLQVEDIVTRFNGQPVHSEADFREMVARTAPGTTVPVTVIRNGQEKSLSVTVGRPDDVAAAVTPDQQQSRQHARGKLGIGIADASDPAVRQKYSLKDNATGAVIDSVLPDSPAANASLAPGDQIIRLNGRTITSAQQLSDIAASLRSGAHVPVVVKRSDPRNGSQTILAFLDIE